MWMWQLPVELSLQILPLLSFKDIEKCRLVCRRWRESLSAAIAGQPVSWLNASPVLYDVSLRNTHNILPIEREPGLRALHPIINVGNDFFIFERKANERIASSLHVVHKCDYEGSVKLTKQTMWIVPYDVLSVEKAFAAYSKFGSLSHFYTTPEQREGCFNTVEIFERKTFKPLPQNMALENVVAMCQKNDVIYHLCFLKDLNSTSGRCFTLFALRNLQWHEVARTAVTTITRLVDECSSLCGLNFMKCKPHLQEDNSLVMWTCGRHSNRLFLVHLNDGYVKIMELDTGSYSANYDVPFTCPTVLFGEEIYGVRAKTRTNYLVVSIDVINIGTGKLLRTCEDTRNLNQVRSENYLVYIMEMYEQKEFLLLCIDKNRNTVREAKFPYYPHGIWNDVRMLINEELDQLFIHIVSNEVGTSLRCSNHVFAFDLLREDLNLSMRVFDLGLSHYPPAVSASSGLVMQDLKLFDPYEDISWHNSIKISSINQHGIMQLSGKQKGTTECGPDSEPVYLSNCKNGVWKRNIVYEASWLLLYNPGQFIRCSWCDQALLHHVIYFFKTIPFRMDPAVIRVEDEMLRVEYDSDGDLDEESMETDREYLLNLKGKCLGFLADMTFDFDRDDGNGYLPCSGDGRSCMHSRWSGQ